MKSGYVIAFFIAATVHCLLGAHSSSAFAYNDHLLTDLARHNSGGPAIVSAWDVLGPGICANSRSEDPALISLPGSGRREPYGGSAWWSSDKGGKRHPLSGVYACAVVDIDNDGVRELIGVSTADIGVWELGEDGIASGPVPLVPGSPIMAASGVWPGDYNNDGRVDLYITRYADIDRRARFFEDSYQYRKLSPVSANARRYAPLANQLLENLGDRRFEDVATERAVANRAGRSLSAVWQDFDNDGWLDLYVANDYPAASVVYLNVAGRRFSQSDHRFVALEVPGVRSATFVCGADATPEYAVLTRGAGDGPALYQLGAGVFERIPLPSKARFRLRALSQWGASRVDWNGDGIVDVFIASGGDKQHLSTPYSTAVQPNVVLLRGAGGAVESLILDDAQFQASSRSVLTLPAANGKHAMIHTANQGTPVQSRASRVVTDPSPASDLRRHMPVIIKFGDGFDDAWLIGAKITLKQSDQTRRYCYGPQQTYMSVSYLPLALSPLSDEPIELEIELRNGWRSVLADVTPGSEIEILATSGQYRVLSAGQQNKLANLQSAIPTLPGPYLQTLLKILLSSPNSHRYSILTQKVWDALSVSEKRELLLAGDPTDANSTLVHLALTDNDESIVSIAVSLVSQTESAENLDLLLSVVTHRSQRVACKAISALEDMFVREESLIADKNRAIPRLIKITQSTRGVTRHCAIRALGRTEQSVAASFLYQTLQRDPDSETRVHLLNAIGHVRSFVEPDVLGPLLNPYQVPARVTAAACGALLRLASNGNKCGLEDLLAKADPVRNTEQMSWWLSLFVALADQDELSFSLGATMIDRAMDMAGQLLDEAATAQLSTETLVLVMALLHSYDLTHTPIYQRLLERIDALPGLPTALLVEAAKSGATERWFASWFPAASVGAKAQFLQDLPVESDLPPGHLQIIAKAVFRHTSDDRHSLLKHMRSRDLVEIVHSGRLRFDNIGDLFGECISRGLVGVFYNPGYFSELPDAVRPLYLDCVSGPSNEGGIGSGQFAASIYLNRLLKAPSFPQRAALEMLVSASVVDDNVRVNLLPWHINKFSELLLLKASIVVDDVKIKQELVAEIKSRPSGGDEPTQVAIAKAYTDWLLSDRLPIDALLHNLHHARY